MKNKELVDKRFTQVDGKIKTLKFLLSRESTRDEFIKEINNLEEIVNDLKSIVERDLSPLRNG